MSFLTIKYNQQNVKKIKLKLTVAFTVLKEKKDEEKHTLHT